MIDPAVRVFHARGNSERYHVGRIWPGGYVAQCSRGIRPAGLNSICRLDQIPESAHLCNRCDMKTGHMPLTGGTTP